MKPTTPGFVGEKLREARLARGLNATALADLLQVSRQSVSKYENDMQAPSPQVMTEICSILKLPVDYFIHDRKRQIDLNSPIFYRSISSATKGERLRAESRYIWLQDIYAYLFRFVNFPTLNFLKLDLSSDPALITDDFIEDSAKQLREFWNLGLGPISNIMRLVENNGIIVGAYDLETATLDAFSQFQYDVPHIVQGIDKRSSVRNRFNMAHELGHLLLHRNISLKTLNTPKYFSLIEKQANRFAAAFLFPDSAFYEEFIEASIDFFRLKKQTWKISIGAQIIRAKDLGLISEEQSVNLWRSYSRQGMKKCEPLDDVLELEMPSLLKNGFRLIVENNIRTRSSIAHELKLSSRDIEEMSGLDPGYLQNEVLLFPVRKDTGPLTQKFAERRGEVYDLFAK